MTIVLNTMRVKICGLRDKENIERIAEMHFDYLGFIFYPKSKRYVGVDFVMPAIIGSAKKVGVFVNAEINELVDIVTKYHLNAIQLHGDESPEYCIEINEKLKGQKIEIIKAFGVDDSFDFDGMVKAGEIHDTIFRSIVEYSQLDIGCADVLALNVGDCKICKTCTYPDGEECRFPDKAVASVESYCIDVNALLTSCGIPYNNGPNTVSFVGLFPVSYTHLTLPTILLV